MSRTLFPADFVGQQTLQTAINKKFLADGAGSVLNGYFTDHAIVFATDITDGAAAKVFDTNSSLDLGTSEAATIDRDNAFELPWKRTLNWVQYLKVHFKPNPKELVNWGIPALVGGEIKYPSDFAGRSAITSAIIAKHLGYPVGTTSPLQPFITANGDDITALAAKVVTADESDLIKTEKKSSSVVLTGKRRKKWATPNTHLKNIGEFLKTLYPDDNETMGLYGFVEVDTPLPTTLRTVTLLPLRDKEIAGIVLGSVLENTGSFPFVIYTGRKKAGPAIPVAVGQKIGMNKGFSTIVSSNPNSMGTVTFTVTVY